LIRVYALPQVGLPRFLNLDALAARFSRWLAPAAVASGAGPGDAKNEYDPSAIVAALGEIERRGDEPMPNETHEA
jgi:hypothetical protein